MHKQFESTSLQNDLKLPTHKSNQSDFKKKVLTIAISLALSFTTNSEVFNVTESTDNGTGLVENTLSWAILQSNTRGFENVITLNTDVRITGVMKRLIDWSTKLQSDEIRRTIDGDNKFRPLFIKSGNVVIENIDMVNGKAQGGSSFLGGSGAGMGGSLFIYDGNVSINNVLISNSKAIAGQTAKGGWYRERGGGGMFGDGARFGGGGLFESAYHSNDNLGYGAYGGYGYYRNNDPKFGEGSGYQFISSNLDAGFGGGGGTVSFGYVSSNGGFGGGGSYGTYVSKNGGFGGGGTIKNYLNTVGLPGYGAFSKYAAGMGGAIFIRSGSLNLSNVTIETSQATATDGAKGLGGALFIMHTTKNSNGNNQGMPLNLPTVNGCNLTFKGNTASGDTNTSNNNHDVFDLANNFNNIGNCEDLIFKNSFE